MTDLGWEYLGRVTKKRRLTIDDESAIRMLLTRDQKPMTVMDIEILEDEPDYDARAAAWSEFSPG